MLGPWGRGKQRGAGVGVSGHQSEPGRGHEAPSLLLGAGHPPPLRSPFLPPPASTSEALVGMTGRLNRALGISNLGGYYTGMFTERQLPGK